MKAAQAGRRLVSEQSLVERCADMRISNTRPTLVLSVLLALSRAVFAADSIVVGDAEPQPLLALAERIEAGLHAAGGALKAEDAARLRALGDAPQKKATARAVQEVLDPYCLAAVHINPEMRVKVSRGPAQARLVQGGWSTFLVKVHNESGTQARLGVSSPNAELPVVKSSGQPEPRPETVLTPGQVANRFLEIQLYRRPPMTETLLGGTVEYVILQVYTSASGAREALLSFDVGAGTADLGKRSELPVLFQCGPSAKMVFHVRDVDGQPATASFVIRDRIDRRATEDQKPGTAEAPLWGPDARASRFKGIYPLPSRRVAATDEYPDFFFQRQVYRADGEHVNLPAGTYDIAFTRGPEYLPQTKTVTIAPEALEQHEQFDLKRWIHLAALGWYSADHHVHAGGCSHYESPEAGVTPLAMMRQGLGEDLNVSCVLTWGPCWYHQKTHFEGANHALSQPSYLMRYDVEVSGFPSSHAGHVCLLRLKEDDYPGTTKIEEWPSWTLPVMKWAQGQGAVAGYAHSGWGLEPQTPTTDFPNYVIPKFDGIGANEYIVTSALGVVDFISTVDTPAPWELNIWYHTLNCGSRARISGETDFPCIYDERVGMGRSYAKFDGALNFDGFAQKIKEGGNYVSDGKSHIVDFRVDDTEMGQKGSELKLASAQRVKVGARVAAYLPETQDEVGAFIAQLAPTVPPYWDLERARVGQTRAVKVELIVNGAAVDAKEIAADGKFVDVAFERDVAISSWVALRIYQSSHTNPIFVLVGDQPIRASKKSAEWCMKSVDRCWEMKRGAIREAERPAAEMAYTEARRVYEAALAESVKD